MPITLLDIILLVVMLISGLLAMIRGFMREVLSIASWAAAAIITLYAYPKLLPAAKQYVQSDLIATALVVVGVFLCTLIVVSIFTVKISDMILDSRVGALDRTLGLLFGLGRGLIVVVVAFLFFAWLVPERNQPDWVKSAKSLRVLQGTGDWLMSALPDVEGWYETWKQRQKRDQQEPPDSPPGERSNLVPPASGDLLQEALYERRARSAWRASGPNDQG